VNKTIWVGIAIVAAIAAVVLVLAVGGPQDSGAAESISDVAVGEGPNPPGDTALAEITDVSVRKDGETDLVFEVTIATDLPAEIPNGSLGFRWDVIEDGEATWMVSANLDTGPTAAVTALASKFGASTVDGTLDGTITVERNKLTITFDRTAIDGFPTSFAWRVGSTLDGDRSDPGSATATDSGQGQL
jgi:hypothetical protein